MKTIFLISLLVLLCIVSADNFRSLQDKRDNFGYDFPTTGTLKGDSTNSSKQVIPNLYDCDPRVDEYCPCDPLEEDCSCWDCYRIYDEINCFFVC